MIKDVDYYKPRIKDLPYTLVNTIEELYKEAASHRFICMSLSELCSALELEYSANSFESDSQKNYININVNVLPVWKNIYPRKIRNLKSLMIYE